MNYLSKLGSAFLLVTTLVTTIFLPIQAMAGSQEAAQIQHKPEDIVKFAKGVEKYAAEHGARAFIIARVGRPAEDLPKGIYYTHTAIAVYSEVSLEDGQKVNAYAIHNLYQNADNKNRSSLVIDYPVDFFWGAYELKAGIVIPRPQVQQQLIDMISKGEHKKLHNPNYSVVANPYNSMYQNCTEHTLDMLNAAIYETTNTQQLKTNAKAHFTAQRVRTNRFKLMLGSMFMDDVTTKDHKGKVKTATFTSIANYLTQYDLAEVSVTLDQGLVANPI